MRIKDIKARMILDSRGYPTVECDLILNQGVMGRAAVPSGASTGAMEALELRDHGEEFLGKGVDTAINNIRNVISESVIGKTFENFAEFDHELIALDGTENKSNFGANAILAMSLAFAKAEALAKNIQFYQLFDGKPSLPKPMFNIINGGAHADNALDTQEFMIMPQFDEYERNLRSACEITYSLKKLLKTKGYTTNVGDEGGFAPELKSDTEALDLIAEAVGAAGYKFGKEVYICLDVAASEIFSEKKYHFKGLGKVYEPGQLVEHYAKLCNHYPIFSIEDGMAEDDFDGWALLTNTLGSDVQLVGDDLFVTNPKIFSKLAADHLGNAILIKPNQIGTLSETVAVIHAAKTAGYHSVISHRSGETEDTTIAHIAVGTGAGQIKTGAPVRTDRTAKYNELLRIGENL